MNENDYSYKKRIYEEVYGVTINYRSDLKIVEGVDHFKPIEEIAEECNMPVEEVKKRIKKIGPIITKRNEIYNETIEQLKNDDYTDEEIANELGISTSQIKKIQEISLKTNSRRTKERSVETPKIPKKQRDKVIIQGLGKGKTQEQIAKEIEVSPSSVSRRIKKMRERGVKIPTLSKEQRDDIIIQRLREGKSSQVQTEVNQEIIQEHYEKAMLYIIQLKHATKDQIIKLAKYYGIDANSFFEKYKAQIRFFNGDYR